MTEEKLFKNQNYEIKWTELGLAFAAAKASKEQVEAQCRAELMEFLPADEEADFFFHTVVIGPVDDGVAFTVEPEFDEQERFVAVVIDSCVYEESPPLEDGPFKGKKLMMPHPATRYRTGS